MIKDTLNDETRAALARLVEKPARARRPAPESPRFAPGTRLSVELDRCGHRARVEALPSGYLPRRAVCSICRRWVNTRPTTARPPTRNATRSIVAERNEERDGRLFTVKVLATPRRARLREP